MAPIALRRVLACTLPLATLLLAMAAPVASAPPQFLERTFWHSDGYYNEGRGVGIYDWNNPDDYCVWKVPTSSNGTPVLFYYDLLRAFPATAATAQAQQTGPILPMDPPLDDCLDAYADANQTLNADGIGGGAGSSVIAHHLMDSIHVADVRNTDTYVGYCSTSSASTANPNNVWYLDMPLVPRAFGGADVVGASGPGRSDGCSDLGWHDFSGCLTYTTGVDSLGFLTADQPIFLEGGPADPGKLCNRHVDAPGLGTNYIAEYCVETDLLNILNGVIDYDVRDGDHFMVVSAPLTQDEQDFLTAQSGMDRFVHTSNLELNLDTGQCDP